MNLVFSPHPQSQSSRCRRQSGLSDRNRPWKIHAECSLSFSCSSCALKWLGKGPVPEFPCGLKWVCNSPTSALSLWRWGVTLAFCLVTGDLPWLPQFSKAARQWSVGSAPFLFLLPAWSYELVHACFYTLFLLWTSKPFFERKSNLYTV